MGQRLIGFALLVAAVLGMAYNAHGLAIGLMLIIGLALVAVDFNEPAK